MMEVSEISYWAAAIACYLDAGVITETYGKAPNGPVAE
jgi:hypothetical protein